MKKCKRLMSLILVLTMVFSLSTVAMAAEPDESNNIVTGESSATQSDLEVMPASDLLINLTGIYAGSSATTINRSITIPSQGGYLYLAVMTEGPIRMTMYSNGVQVSTVYVQRTWNEGEVQWVPVNFDRTTNNFWGSGNFTIKVEVLFNYDYSFAVCLGKYEI